jgi:predicted metal-binding membrane protein
MSDDRLRAVLRRDRVIVLASLGALTLLAWA